MSGDWPDEMTLCYIMYCRGDTGLCPVNHLNTCPETVATPASGDQVSDAITMGQQLTMHFNDRPWN